MTQISWNELVKNSSGSFDPLPKGDYNVYAVESNPAVSGNGKLMLKVKFKIESGTHAGRHLWNNFTLSPENPNALSFFFQHMAVFGMDKEFFQQLPDMNPDNGANDPGIQIIANTMLNKRACLTVEQRTWQGQARSDVTQVKPYNPTLASATPAPGTPGQTPAPAPVPGSASVPTPQAPPPAPAPPIMAPVQPRGTEQQLPAPPPGAPPIPPTNQPAV